MGVSVVTLHQGTGGIVNGSLINPWINYPFLNDTVPLLTNYTEQANALGMAVKMYYTIRELSARAVEMFAFKVLKFIVIKYYASSCMLTHYDVYLRPVDLKKGIHWIAL